jgi:hypothetical protein
MNVFDLSVYYPIPLLTTEGYISLFKSLLMVAPANPPPHIVEAIEEFMKGLSEAEGILVLRIDEDLSTWLERIFDLLVDQVWVETRERLEFAAIYRHEGVAKFTQEDRIALDLEARIKEAHTANKMLERMFANGVDFLRTPFPQQATHTAARLDWVTAKNLDPEFEQLVGPKLTTLLKVCQNRYEVMVAERSSRDGKSVADLRDLRINLRRHIYSYAGAIGSMYKISNPQTAEVVENALRPILIAREHARRKSLGLPEGEQAVDEELEVEEELEEDVEDENDVEDEEPIEPDNK